MRDVWSCIGLSPSIWRRWAAGGPNASRPWCRHRALPEAEQDQLAAAIRAEIAAECAWEARLAVSPDALAALVDEALDEHRPGRTLPLERDEQ